MYLYYQLINSLKQADSVDIVVSFLMDYYQRRYRENQNE